MKHTLLYPSNTWINFLLFIFLVMASVTFTSAHTKEAVIGKAAVSPVVDGIEDQVWVQAAPNNIALAYRQETPTLGTLGQTWWKGLWTDKGIYILVNVTDDTFSPAYAETDYTMSWMHDKVELYIDANYIQKDGMGPAHGKGHYNYAPVITENMVNFGQTANIMSGGSTYCYKVNGQSYVAEFFIPFSELLDKDLYTLDKSEPFGFDITVIDNDVKEPVRNRMVWANTGIIDECWNNMDDAGLVVLGNGPFMELTTIQKILLTPGAITTNMGTLQMVPVLEPAWASLRKIQWSVINESGKALISQTGVVTALSNGTVMVQAVSKDDPAVKASTTVTISSQLADHSTPWNLNNLIRNWDFNNGMTNWSYWADVITSSPVIENGVVKITNFNAHDGNYWHYQFNQFNLDAVPNVPYVLKFKSWSSIPKNNRVNFEGTSENNIYRCGVSTDAEAIDGRSEWQYNTTTEPQWYIFHVVFDQILSTTFQKLGWMLSNADATTYLDSILLIKEEDFNNTPFLGVSKNSLTMDSEFESYGNFDITSNTSWQINCDQPWVTFHTLTGTGNKNITITAQANPQYTKREAIIKVSAAGLSSQTLMLIQPARPETSITLNVTPGNLSSLMTDDELAQVTELKLTGTIDARDFKTMRDNMPSLALLDLKDVHITAYSGSEGTYDGNLDYPANTLPKNALNNKSLTSITIPTSASSIGDGAFGNCQLVTSIAIPHSVLSIGNGAFMNCSQLSSIFIPSSVKIIGTNAFSDFKGSITVDINNPSYSSQDSVLFDKMKTVLIQCSNKKTGNYIIPSTVTSIIDVAFGSNSTLASVTIPASVTSIGDYSFNSFSGSITVNTANPNFSSADGVLFDKNKTTLIHCPIKKAGSYVIPPSVTTIKPVAFQNCSALTNINFPSSLTYIGDSSFGNCTGLTTLDFPASINYIGYNAFNGCGNINTITFASSILSIKGGAFFGVNQLSSIYVHVRNPITLDNSIFINLNYSTCKLFVPFGSSTLYSKAFQWQDFRNIVEMPGIILSTTNVTLGSENTSTISIRSSDSIKISSDQSWFTLSSVAGNAGETILTLTADNNTTSEILKATITVSCKGVNDQFISVIKLGKVPVTAGGLENTLGLLAGSVTRLTLSGTIDARDFKTMRDNMPLLAVLDLSDVKIGSYTGTEGSKAGNTYYPADEIPEQAFYIPDKYTGKTSLTSITFPSDLKSLGASSFIRCTGLSSLSLPEFLTSIMPNAFSLCSSLTSVSLPASLNFIGSGAFEMCSGLLSIEIPKLVTSINAYTFQGCEGLSSINIPSTVKSIGMSAFLNCKKTSSINISSSVTSIDFQAFAGCSGMISVDGDNSNYSSMDGVLYNKEKTELIQCPTSISGNYTVYSKVKRIWRNAFENCTNLTAIILPQSLTTIDRDAFYNCSGISSITVHNGVPIDLSLAYAVFYNINTSAILNVPFGSKGLYCTADQWKTFKNIIEGPNQGPTANAGLDQLVNEGLLFTLYGTGTDPDGNAITYHWNAPAGIILSSTTASSPTFTAPEVSMDTTLIFTFHVNDGLLSSKTDSVLVTIKQVHKAPVAHAGSDQQINENTLVTLDGTLSRFPESNRLTYLWTASAGITLSSSTDAKPTFTAPEISNDTTFTFSLVVNDGLLNSTADEIIISVKNIDKPPYVKVPIENIATDKGSIEKTIDLNQIFADHDWYDTLSFSVASNSNEKVVQAKITGSVLTLKFSSNSIGTSDIDIMASSKGKQADAKFKVDLLSPLGLNPIAYNDPFSVYPNPTSGRVNFMMKQTPRKGTFVTVHDLSGKLILRHPLDSQEQWIYLEGNPPGVYLLKTNLKDGKVQRIVLK